ncbi:MAG: aldo/keto reductase, partial [Caulobacterales bacterium]
MERRILGRTGLSVSMLGIGAAQLGVFDLSDEAECVRVAHECFDAGVNLIDTADFYSFGKSEKVVAKVITDRRDKIIVASKCGMPLSADSNERGGSRRWIMTAIDRSLKRLNTDYIDIYQLHAPDPRTEIEETIDAMNDLIKAGKIRYFGTSNFTGQMTSEAHLRGKLAGLTPPHSEQSEYSIFNRAPEAEVLPANHKYGVGFLAYSPLDGGWLSGKYRKAQAFEKSARQKVQPDRFDLQNPINADKLERVEKLIALAKEAGMDLGHLAIGFVLA